MPPAATHLHDKIVKFLAENLVKKERQMVVALEVEVVQSGCRPEEVKTWLRESDPEVFALEYADRIAAEIVELCEERADLYRMAECTFKLRAVLFGGGRPAYGFRIAPSIDGDNDNAGMMQDLPANATGVLAMQIRNNEFIMRQNQAMTSGTIATLTSQIKELREENKELRAERQRLIAERNADKASESERELAVVRQAHSEQRKDLLVGKAVQMLPIVASRMLESKTGSAGATTALTHLVAELGQSLAPQQAAQLAGMLTIQQRALFGEVMRLAKLAQDAAAAAEASAGGASKGEASAGGAGKVNGSATPAAAPTVPAADHNSPPTAT